MVAERGGRCAFACARSLKTGEGHGNWQCTHTLVTGALRPKVLSSAPRRIAWRSPGLLKHMSRQHAQHRSDSTRAQNGCNLSAPKGGRPVSQYDFLIKLLLIGNSSCGKSSLLLRYVEDSFEPSRIATIGIDFRMRTIDVLHKRAKLQIWDTAGQERFRTITQAYYRGAMGIIIVYDVSDRESFEDVKRDWIKNVDRHVNVDVRKTLVGNKSDKEDERVVSTEEGQKLADALGIRFFETSALRGDNVDNVFLSLATDIREHQLDELARGRRIPSTDKVVAVGQPWQEQSYISRCC